VLILLFKYFFKHFSFA